MQTTPLLAGLGAFLAGPRVARYLLPVAELEPVAELLLEEIHAMGGKLKTVEQDFSVMRVGDRLRDPDTGDVLGYQGIYVGQGDILG